MGDIISFASQPEELAGDTIAGHTLDNRASVAAATVALELLAKRRHLWDVVVAATVQEEVGCIGGFGSDQSQARFGNRGGCELRDRTRWQWQHEL